MTNDYRIIPNFPNYAVTKDGRVWSKPKRGHNGKWLKAMKDKNGYFCVDLQRNDRRFMRKTHQLVLETYVGMRPKGMECRHLNGKPWDNRLKNLCWGTKSENARDRVTHGTAVCGSRVGTAKLTEKKVKIIRYLRNIVKFSLKNIAWQFNVNTPTISMICTYKTWRHVHV